MNDGKKELAFLSRIVKEAWKVCGGADLHTRAKGTFDLVTDVDFAMEKFISSAIESEFGGDCVVGEELNPLRELPAGRSWTVDPIDGTVNMAHGLPLFGVQCAFCIDGTPLASVIFLPRFDELYTALKGGGVRLNGEAVSVSKAPLRDAVVSVGDYSHRTAAHAERQAQLVGKVYDKVAKLRHFGAASVDFSWFAAGRTNGFVVFARNLWDRGPGVLMSEEAGGVVRSVNGDKYDFSEEGVVVAATEEIADEFAGRA